MPDLPTFVTHLECSAIGEQYPADTAHGLSDAGKPLLVRYDLDAVARAVTPAQFASRCEGGLWRYAELLPVRHAINRVSLGEVVTPMIRAGRQAAPGRRLWIKDEGRLPTGSFKARGLVLAVSMARELGLRHS